MINGLLERDKRTLWCEGYDSPIVLTPLRALTIIAYMYANPAKDNLETTIDRYYLLSAVFPHRGFRPFGSGVQASDYQRFRYLRSGR
ncbi:MAG: hypothetical protein RIS36_721 [Pseudomonadota bacterium]